MASDDTTSMFDHPDFEKYQPEELPLDSDMYLRDENYLGPYEQSFVEARAGGEWKNVGYVSWIAVRRVTPQAIELSWFANIFDRYHEVAISLPKDQIILCVGSRSWSERISIFVKKGWIEKMYVRFHSVFGFIDAANVREALAQGLKIDEFLPQLRSGIDAVAVRYPQIAFVSFADSLFLKSNWTAGYFERGVPNTYDPEAFLRVFTEIRAVYKETIGLSVYGVFTQGSNEFHGDAPLHISQSKNHVCLNAMGAPFADLLSIESSARAAAKKGIHPFSELYLEETYFHSLKRKFSAKERASAEYPYIKTLSKTEAHYICTSCDELMAELKIEGRFGT